MLIYIPKSQLNNDKIYFNKFFITNKQISSKPRAEYFIRNILTKRLARRVDIFSIHNTNVQERQHEAKK